MIDAPRHALMHRGAMASASLLVLFLAAWQWGPGWLGIPPFIVPPLSMVTDEALRMWQVNHLLIHNGVTAGCGTTSYCPNSSVTRAQMAVFLLRSRHGASFVPRFT